MTAEQTQVQTTIKLLNERVYPVAQLSKKLPIKVCVDTLKNWATAGVRNPRGRLCFLESMLIGARRYSSVEAFERFCAETNVVSDE